MFLFMLFFRITWWIAPDKKRVDQLFKIYTHLLKMEEGKKRCLKMQEEMNACIRPRTENHEWLTTRKQREYYPKGKPIRGSSHSRRRDRYTDYDEAQKYHNGGQTGC